MKIRKISVKPGDAFNEGYFAGFVVEGIVGERAEGRWTDTGRKSTIAVRRLQRDYSRLGEVDTKTQHRRLAEIDKLRRAKRVRP